MFSLCYESNPLPAQDGTLAKRLDQFVQEYDGRTPYDVHLILQVPKLLSKNSVETSIKITDTELYNTTNAEHDWQLIAKKYIGQHAKLLFSYLKMHAVLYS